MLSYLSLLFYSRRFSLHGLPGCVRAAVATTRLIESKARGNRHVNHGVQHLSTSFERQLSLFCVLCVGFFILVDFHRMVDHGVSGIASVATARHIESKARGNRQVNHGTQPLIISSERALVSCCRTYLVFYMPVDSRHTFGPGLR